MKNLTPEQRTALDYLRSQNIRPEDLIEENQDKKEVSKSSSTKISQNSSSNVEITNNISQKHSGSGDNVATGKTVERTFVGDKLVSERVSYG